MSEQLKTATPEPATTRTDAKETEVGSVFVSNYPRRIHSGKKNMCPDVINALNSPPTPEATLGLYLHIPFCRKRCKFCYFRVYTRIKIVLIFRLTLTR